MGDQAKREALRIEDSLSKPVKQSELFESIVRVLSGTAPQAPRSDDGTRVQELPPLRILLVEDSDFNQKFAVALLKQHNHQVEIANHGLEAIEKHQRNEYDVILMDVQMPEMDGMEATRRIRQSEADSGKHTPIVAMTAHAMKDDRQQCIDAGMDEYVSKPIDAPTLFATLGKVTAADEIVLDFAVGGDEKPAAVEYELAEEQPSFNDRNDDGLVRPDDDGAEDRLIVDFEEALKRVGGSAKTLKTLAFILAKECPKLISEIDSAIQNQDARSLRRAAHTLKGSANHFAASYVVQTARQLEEHGANGEFQPATELFGKLQMEVERLCARIRQRFPQ